MAYIIAAPCADVKDRACVQVCPVECIYEVNAVGEIGIPDSSMGSGMKDKVVFSSGVVHHLPSDISEEDAACIKKQLVIHPEECIDCGACVPECPVEAIFADSDLPEEWKKYEDLNRKAFGL